MINHNDSDCEGHHSDHGGELCEKTEQQKKQKLKQVMNKRALTTFAKQNENKHLVK